MTGGAERRMIGVVAEWQAVDHPWIDHRWVASAVLDGVPDVPPWTCLEEDVRRRRYYAGAAELVLFPRETDTLKHNLEAASPAVYVFLRSTAAAPGMALIGATVCVGEAHAHADTGCDLVEAVPMPPAIAEWVGNFVACHHVERAAYRRRREAAGERDGRGQMT